MILCKANTLTEINALQAESTVEASFNELLRAPEGRSVGQRR